MGRKYLGPTRRIEIVNAFYEVSKKVGLENASIAKVANYLGISNGLVMHYFNTKEELLFELKDYILKQHLNLFTKENNEIKSRADLEKLIVSLFSREWNNYFDDGVFYSCYALIYRNNKFNNSFKSYLLKLHDVLEDKLHQAYENGVILNTNIHELTEVIFALVDGSYYLMGMFDYEDIKDKKQLDIYISHSLSLFNYV